MIKKSIRFVCTSDTHEEEGWELGVPDGDVLIHCGDFTRYGSIEQTKSFVKKFTALPHKKKILIAGNHDVGFDLELYESLSKQRNKRKGYEYYPKDPMLIKGIVTENPDIIYLENEGIEVGGYKVYGIPYMRLYSRSAFQRNEEVVEKLWKAIPSDTDILITHPPPYGMGDKANCSLKGHCGAKFLRKEVEDRIKPIYHLFGHIHEGSGVYKKNNITYINCSRINKKHKVVNTPYCFDLPIKETQI